MVWIQPPVTETPDGRCALRVARKSFCTICTYQPICLYLARDLGLAPSSTPAAIALAPASR